MSGRNLTLWRTSAPQIAALGRRYLDGESLTGLSRDSGIPKATLLARMSAAGFTLSKNDRAARQRRGKAPEMMAPVSSDDQLLARLRKVHPGVSA